MSSGEKTDDKIVRINYTNRHKHRLTHKRSLNECKKIYKKVKENRAYNIPSDENQMDFSCNSLLIQRILSLYNILTISLMYKKIMDWKIRKFSINIIQTKNQKCCKENEENISINNKT